MIFMLELTYEELRRIQSREREPGLSKLQDNFYEQVGVLLSKYKGANDTSEQREYENILKILRYIHSRREEKILNASINSTKGVEPPSGMLKEELELYRKFVDLIRSDKEGFEKGLCSGLFGSGSAASSRPGENIEIEMRGPERREPASDCFSVKIVRDIDEFVGLDGKTYGPYKSGSRAVLPAKEAETLLKMKMIEKTDMELA